MKSFKQLIAEVAEPKSEDELNFKAKHEIEMMDHPESEEHQHTTEKKGRKRLADYAKGEDMTVYEASYRDNGYRNMYKASRKADREADKIRAQAEKDAKKQNSKKMSEDVTDKDTVLVHSHKMGKDMGKYAVLNISKVTSTQIVAYDHNTGKEVKFNRNTKRGLGDGDQLMIKKIVTESTEKKMDPVDHKALKGDFKDREDKDIDNDGKVDDSDRYLHKRRQAISKSMKESGDLSEISKKTLGSYIKKASDDMAGNAYQLGARDPLKPKASWSKAFKRGKGIAKATNRLTKEEVDLSENFKQGSVSLNDGSKVVVSKQNADLLNQMFDDLNARNKKEMLKVAMTDKDGFNEILGFAREAL